MTKIEAMDLVETYFTFDDVGEQMTALRKDISNEEKQAALAAALVECAMEDDDSSEDDRDSIVIAAKERVDEYVASVKSTRGTGCGK